MADFRKFRRRENDFEPVYGDLRSGKIAPKMRLFRRPRYGRPPRAWRTLENVGAGNFILTRSTGISDLAKRVRKSDIPGALAMAGRFANRTFPKTPRSVKSALPTLRGSPIGSRNGDRSRRLLVTCTCRRPRGALAVHAPHALLPCGGCACLSQAVTTMSRGISGCQHDRFGPLPGDLRRARKPAYRGSLGVPGGCFRGREDHAPNSESAFQRGPRSASARAKVQN